MEFSVRWMRFHGVLRPILLQDVEGPCPILAVCNALFLRGSLMLDSTIDRVKLVNLIKCLQQYLRHKREKDPELEKCLSMIPSFEDGMGTFQTCPNFEFYLLTYEWNVRC
jgi:hypothetical protein